MKTAAEAARGIATALRPLLANFEALADALEANETDGAPYTSHVLPADCPSRERFRRLAALIHCEHGDAAAWRVGQTWNVTREAWARHRGVSARATEVPKTLQREADDLIGASRSLAGAGLRLIEQPKEHERLNSSTNGTNSRGLDTRSVSVTPKRSAR